MTGPQSHSRSAWASLEGVGLVTIAPLGRVVSGALTVPGSKSVTNRALIMAAAAQGRSRVTGVLRSDDSFWCLEALRRLGVGVVDDGAIFHITRSGAWHAPAEPVFIGSAGTTGRFLTSVLALSNDVPITISASNQLSARPMRPLFEALTTLGAKLSFGATPGAFPVTLSPRGPGAEIVEMSGIVSSQFISGVLMGAPLLDRPVEVRITDRIVQADYVRITLAMLGAFGISVETSSGFDLFRVRPAAYRPTDYAVEADASTASYFLALAAATGGEITLKNLPAETFQPDIRFLDVLERMGCRVTRSAAGTTLKGPGCLKGGFTADMNACSDTALTLAAVAPFADAPIAITGVAHIRKHECDRVAVMAASLAAVGVPVQERADGLRVSPAKPAFARLETHDDHRVAMSLAVLGAAGNGVALTDPGCVSKTCPDFFAMISGLGVECVYERSAHE